MNRMALAVMLALALGVVLSGCNLLPDGEYIWTETFQLPQSPEDGNDISISNYLQVQKVLTDMVEQGETSKIVYVVNYQPIQLEEDVKRAVDSLRSYHPIAAYALQDIQCEMGNVAGSLAMVIHVSYRHDRVDVSSIQNVADISEAKKAVETALKNCQSSIVMQVQNYTLTDFGQIVEQYALQNPHIVMEMPQVVENTYPDTGNTRVVELKLHYQSSRDALKSMQDKVAPVFAAAALYVSGDSTASVKFSQLYTFLMERYNYTIQTSITPAYSLLRNGIGDSKAFALVYAAMCRQAGLECITVTGTRNGANYYWNIVCCDGVYYHLDLLRCEEEKRFYLRSDWDMTDYVWNYSDYPDCGFADTLRPEK